ncbi:MAG: chemotaxis protein CheA [Bacteroidales bacterium]|nr:chemotaxis protein CheA [Bacteroidales bacterium]
MDDIVKGFIEEVKELLLQLEDDLITLENNPGNPEIVNNIFRVMHTLKGSAGMVGYKNIQDLTHEFENTYEQIREGKLQVNSDIIDITLKAKDLILVMLAGEADDSAAERLIQLLADKAAVTGKSNIKRVSGTSTQLRVSNHLYVILFSPDKGIFERGLNPDKTVDELKASGETHVILHEKKKSWEKQKAEKICATVWEVYLKTSLAMTEVEDIFLFYDKDEYSIFEMSREQLQIDPFLSEKLESLYKHKIAPEQQLRDCIDQLPDDEPVQNLPAEQPDASLAELKSTDTSRIETDSKVNVSSQKLDELMNLVSELVTITGTVEVHAEKHNDLKLNNALENIAKLTKKFRDNALDLRLVPIGTLLGKFKRQIRDLSRDLGKKVNMLIEGQDIEIDKTILKSIESPLQHIIRNSIDHGLEPKEERLAKGKTPEGLLKITAFYSGASVILSVQDDGRGINMERVKECAIKKGYMEKGQDVNKEQLLTFIMEPGFTTSENISMVSGRGVGMDVVRKELNSVGGSIEIFTEENLGTTITMKLPTTLTIIDTLMVNVDETQILIPVMDIEYCFKETNENLFKKDNRYIQYKNSPIPLVSLREQFKYAPSEQNELMVIVINKFDRRYAITADQIIGEHQAVIKPLGDLFVNQPYFSGGSIMIDGKLAFILDTNFLFNHITKI